MVPLKVCASRILMFMKINDTEFLWVVCHGL